MSRWTPDGGPASVGHDRSRPPHREEITVFNTIIVGVDGAEGGRDALLLADRLRRVFGGELVAVHAYSFDFFVNRDVTPDFENTLHANATDLVLEELDRTGVQAHAVAM